MNVWFGGSQRNWRIWARVSRGWTAWKRWGMEEGRGVLQQRPILLVATTTGHGNLGGIVLLSSRRPWRRGGRTRGGYGARGGARACVRPWRSEVVPAAALFLTHGQAASRLGKEPAARTGRSREPRDGVGRGEDDASFFL